MWTEPVTAPWALLRSDAASGRWWRFSSPRAVLRAGRPEEVPALLREVESAADAGLWAVGFVAYEAASGFDPALVTHPPAPDGAAGAPAAWFGLFGEPEEVTSLPGERAASPSAGLSLEPSVPDERYLRDVEAVRRAIARGETYQANLTYRLRGSLAGGPEPLSLFTALHRRQPSPFAAFLDLGPSVVASVSPELFFRRRGEKLLCRPMKGTAPRGLTTARDRELAAALRASEKERAENLMIVDMARNDLGRIARAGTVRVTRLFSVESHPTVHQMTSDVEAESAAQLAEVFAALFPSASVTGAPKVRTLEILAGLETAPRGVYTGAVGHVAPGGDALFNVAIRTAWIDRWPRPSWAPEAEPGPWLEYGTGGGVVWDSEPERELAETRTKALVLERALSETPTKLETAGPDPGSGAGRADGTAGPRKAPAGAETGIPIGAPSPAGAPSELGTGRFKLFETLLWRPGRGFALLERHLARLAASAASFGFALDLHRVERRLHGLHRRLLEEAPRGRLRVRLLVASSGEVSLEARPLGATRRPWTVAPAEEPVDPDDRFLRHKTTRREVYDRALAGSRRRSPDLDDVLLWTPSGELTETTVANLVLRLDGRLLTPPAASGLLPGTLRAELLARGRIREAHLTVGDLRRAEGVYLINSLRGWIPARLATECHPSRAGRGVDRSVGKTPVAARVGREATGTPVPPSTRSTPP